MNDFGRIVERARVVYKSGRTRDVEWRKTQLRNLLRMVEENEDEIAQALKTDLNKSIWEAQLHELLMFKNETNETLLDLDEWTKPTKQKASLAAKSCAVYTVPEPYGTTLVIGAWNYPFTLTLQPVVGAIAGGNTCVIKPSEVASACGELMQKLFKKYLDNEAFPCIVTDGQGSAELLKERFDLIFFTGGPAIGKLVMQAAAKHLTPVVLELGGKNPVWIDPSCDINRAARSILWAKGSNTGQICLCPDYLLCPKSMKPKLIEEMRKVLIDFYGEDSRNSTDYNGKIINKRHTERLVRLIETTTGKVVIGGNYDIEKCFIPITVIDGASPDDPVMQEEIFGPILPIVDCDSLDQALDFINEREKPLAAYCFTRDENVKNRYISETSSGGVTINDIIMHYTEPSLPFGGIGNSGMGSYHGKHTFNAFVHHKPVLEQKTPMAMLAFREAPMTNSKGNIMRILINSALERRLKVFGKLSFGVMLAVFVKLALDKYNIHLKY